MTLGDVLHEALDGELQLFAHKLAVLGDVVARLAHHARQALLASAYLVHMRLEKRVRRRWRLVVVAALHLLLPVEQLHELHVGGEALRWHDVHL